ncbi:response regulator [Cetobacterium sp. 2G large]|uniref:response regulator n=1 Tax=Cetobacterium sp. 2G large TaxID=2759680 RepID=UPI00163B9A34|nr:response regulator [Cetobacterium sp. 2G large]MBC2854519.1 response regulator [Cetobacterium sp. 2G large]
MGNNMLIIDDSEEICFAISEFFIYKGWSVETANSVEKSLEILKNRKFDIILIDYNMPYINGAVGVKLIRALDKDVSIIALTVEGKEIVAESFFEAGANDFAIKPIKMLDLFSRVNVHLNNKKRLKDEEVLPKGIDKNTLNIVLGCLSNKKEYIDVDEISNLTGVATKTVNRYMNYLLDEEKVILNNIYGKIGRPKKEYKLK